jgi:glyoxylase-like metal-dependent hydrolase (beta-lactamase superfamily II)
MQTIARANRVIEGKKNGLVIDYFGVFRNLKIALAAYAEGTKGKPFKGGKAIVGEIGKEWVVTTSGQVYETPGHTRCSLAFLLQPENILFPGDAAGVVEKSGKIKPLFLSSYTLYEQSLKKLSTIKANILALPHNTAIKGERKIRDFFCKFYCLSNLIPSFSRKTYYKIRSSIYLIFF